MKHLMVGTGLLLCCCSTVYALPVDVGDAGLRHDLQLLIDNKLVDLPISAMPASWRDLQRKFDALDALPGRDDVEPSVRRAVLRMKKRIRQHTDDGHLHSQWRFRLANRAHRFISYSDPEREGTEAGAALTWSTERYGLHVNGTVVSEAQDGDELRLDGSQAEVLLGNWVLSANAVDRWWGPGWSSSLVLSNNARPIPAIVIQREHTPAPDLPRLSWLGSWQFTTLLGRLEKDRAVPDALFFGMRFTFRLHNDVEFGLSHTAQWGGRGRPQDGQALLDVLLGHESQATTSGGNTNVTGNHLAGFDMRWNSPVGSSLPYAVYGQFIGEDEAGGLPSRYIGLAGLESWGSLGEGITYRWNLEYADTLAGSISGTPHYGVAYRHDIYQDGYTYKGRVIGHTAGGDGQQTSIGVVAIDSSDRTWTFAFDRRQLDRHRASHSVVQSVELRLDAAPGTKHWTVAAGASRSRDALAVHYDTRLALEWSQSF